MSAPIGTEVGLYVDLVAKVYVGDVIETKRGRRYGVVTVRTQTRGKYAGRQHLRGVVLDPDEPTTARVHRITWYRRGRSGSGGVHPKGRP